jgi:F0F1-type ATP synthase assembly protein I
VAKASDKRPYERNVRKIREALAVLPSNRWTSYGVIGEMVGRFMTDSRMHKALLYFCIFLVLGMSAHANKIRKGGIRLHATWVASSN